MSEQTIRASIFACAVLLFVGACNKPKSVDETPVLRSGYWQASITLPGGDIETGIEISKDGELYQASLVNGQERVRIDEVGFSGGELLLRFPAFNNEIRATLADFYTGIRGRRHDTAVSRAGAQTTATHRIWRYLTGRIPGTNISSRRIAMRYT